MNSIQVLAVLALVSMTVPAALAFMFWRERNEAWYQFNNLEHNYRTLSNHMRQSREENLMWREWYEMECHAPISLRDAIRQWDFS